MAFPSKMFLSHGVSPEDVESKRNDFRRRIKPVKHTFYTIRDDLHGQKWHKSAAVTSKWTQSIIHGTPGWFGGRSP